MAGEKKKIQLSGFETKEDTQSLYKAVSNNVKDKIELEIGDSKDSSEIFPQAKIERWDNEVNLSVRYKEDSSEDAKSVEVKDDTLIWSKGEKEVHIYEKPEIAEDGGLEIEVVLKEKPIGNVIEFSIQTKGLDFFYQPELTEKEKEDGVSRDENVEGSYAVYHKEKSGNYSDMEYKTGKFCHIYRPKVTDSEGKEVWGELNIDEKKKLLTITIDQKWLDSAIYPVLVDPTFGYTSAGGTATTNSVIYATKFTSGSNIDSITKLTIYCKKANGPPNDKFKGAIYTDASDPVLVSNSLTAEKEITSTTADWVDCADYSTSPSISDSTVYAIAFRSTLYDFTTMYYDSGTTGQSWNKSVSIGTTPITSKVSLNYKFSFYATYTASASGPTGVKTINGTAIASVKTVNGTAIASVKTING